MPIYFTDKLGAAQRWATKRQLRAELADMDERYSYRYELTQKQATEIVRLRNQMADDRAAWDDLMTHYTDLAAERDMLLHLNGGLADERDDLKTQINALKAQIDCLDDDSYEQCQADLTATQDRAALMARTLDMANAAMTDARAELDIGTELLAAATHENGVLWDANHHLEVRLDRLAAACHEADEKRALSGRAGRLGTKAIRSIFEWSASFPSDTL